MKVKVIVVEVDKPVNNFLTQEYRVHASLNIATSIGLDWHNSKSHQGHNDATLQLIGPNTDLLDPESIPNTLQV